MNEKEIRIAVQQAKQTLNEADDVAEDLARILDGRLRKVGSSYILGRLKKELRDYNIHTGRWK